MQGVPKWSSPTAFVPGYRCDLLQRHRSEEQFAREACDLAAAFVAGRWALPRNAWELSPIRAAGLRWKARTLAGSLGRLAAADRSRHQSLQRPVRVGPDGKSIAYAVRAVAKPAELWVLDKFLPVTKAAK
jgi:hypothetical protein